MHIAHQIYYIIIAPTIMADNKKTTEKLRKIGLKVKSARFQKELTQEQLAKKVGVSIPRIRAIEDGTGNSGIKTFLKTEHVLGIDLFA